LRLQRVELGPLGPRRCQRGSFGRGGGVVFGGGGRQLAVDARVGVESGLPLRLGGVVRGLRGGVGGIGGGKFGVGGFRGELGGVVRRLLGGEVGLGCRQRRLGRVPRVLGRLELADEELA